MFKNATLYRATGAVNVWPLFSPTGSTQVFSCGFVSPQVGGPLWDQGACCVMLEHRSVPGPTVAKRVDELAAMVERETGRKPGKKQRAELKDEALLELLPKAFPRQTRVMVVQLGDLLVLDTASGARSDEVVTLLAQCGLSVSLVQTEMSPRSLMNCWLHDGAPDYDEFALGRACVLRVFDAEGKTVAYKNAALDAPEVKAHIQAGMQCTSLALTWDDEVEFTLTDSLVLKHLDLGMEFTGEFDGDLALFKPRMKALLDDLLAALN